MTSLLLTFATEDNLQNSLLSLEVDEAELPSGNSVFELQSVGGIPLLCNPQAPLHNLNRLADKVPDTV